MQKQVRAAWMVSLGLCVVVLLLGYWYHVEVVRSLGGEYVYNLTMCEARVAELEGMVK